MISKPLIGPYFGGGGNGGLSTQTRKLEASEEELLHEAGHIAIASVLAASFMVPLSLIVSGDDMLSLGQKKNTKNGENVLLEIAALLDFSEYTTPPKLIKGRLLSLTSFTWSFHIPFVKTTNMWPKSSVFVRPSSLYFPILPMVYTGCFFVRYWPSDHSVELAEFLQSKVAT